MSNPSEEDFEKVPSTSQPNPKYCSSESSLSDDEREQIEHVLKHGAPSEALTPDSERMVVLGEDMVHSAPGSLVRTGNSSWINRIKT